MCSALAGADGSWSNDFEPSGERPWRHGHCFLALDPAAFGGLVPFVDSADELSLKLEGSAPEAGGSGVRLPGRAAHEAEARRVREGVPVREEELRQLLRVPAAAVSASSPTESRSDSFDSADAMAQAYSYPPVAARGKKLPASAVALGGWTAQGQGMAAS